MARQWRRSAEATFRRLQFATHVSQQLRFTSTAVFAVGVSRAYTFQQVPLVESASNHAHSADAHLGAVASCTSQQPAVHVLTGKDIHSGAVNNILSALSNQSSVELIVPLESMQTFLHSVPASLAADSHTSETSALLSSPSNVQDDSLDVTSAAADKLMSVGGGDLVARVDQEHCAPMLSVGSMIRADGTLSGSAMPHTSAVSTPPVLPGEGSFLFDDNEGASTAASAATAQGTAQGTAPMPPSAMQAFRRAEAGDTQHMCQLLQGLPPQDALAVARCAHPRHGGTLLHVLSASVAALEGGAFQAGLDCLCACGIQVNALAANGSTPLHWAAGAGYVEAVTALLAAGADPCAVTYVWRRQLFGKGSGQTPLHWAAESGHTGVIEVLLQGGAGGGALPGWRGGSAALVQAFSSSPHAAAALMPDERGVTAGELAVKSGFQAAGEAIAAVTGERMVRLRVKLAGQVARSSVPGNQA